MEAVRKQCEDGRVNCTTVPLDICNLNDEMDHMCKTIKAAQIQVMHSETK